MFDPGSNDKSTQGFRPRRRPHRVPLFRRLILHNFWAKLMSFFIAILVWFTITIGNQAGPSGESFGYFNYCLVQVLTEPDDPRRFTVTPEVVDITLKGPKKIVEELKNRPLDVFVRVGHSTPGTKFTNQIEYILPPEVQLQEINPATVEIREITENDEQEKTNQR